MSLVGIGRIWPPLRGGKRGGLFCYIGIGAGVELCKISYTNDFCIIYELDSATYSENVKDLIRTLNGLTFATLKATPEPGITISSPISSLPVCTQQVTCMYMVGKA